PSSRRRHPRTRRASRVPERQEGDMMFRFHAAQGAVLALAVLVVTPSAGWGQPTSDECKCQLATAKAQGKFISSKAKCITKCEQGARSGKNPAGACTPPFAGTTGECVQKATDKAITAETKCKDCPECYAGGNCAADAASRTAANEAQLDAFVPLIYCD